MIEHDWIADNIEQLVRNWRRTDDQRWQPLKVGQCCLCGRTGGKEHMTPEINDLIVRIQDNHREFMRLTAEREALIAQLDSLDDKLHDRRHTYDDLQTSLRQAILDSVPK